MKFLSAEWFKAKIEASMDRVTERIISNQFEKLMEQEAEVEVPLAKPYKNVKLVNDSLTIILHDGTILSKPNATAHDYEKAIKAKSETDLFIIVATSQVTSERVEVQKEESRVKHIQKGVEMLATMEDFEVDGDVVYLKGTSRTIPQLLVEQFIQVIGRCGDDKVEPNEDDEYLSLKRFFMWCCLNPRAEVANDLYDFLNRNSFRITKQGFFVALRNVVTVDANENQELVKAVSNAYNKVKAIWKKNPDNYRITEQFGQYSLEKVDSTPKGTIVGNLTTLYLDLPNMSGNRFTDNYTRKFDIRIGKVVNMPMEKCSWSTADCMEAGLHFTADEIHYVGCGDTSVLVLINPMKVVGIGQSKGRCYEYLPIMTVDREEATKILHDGQFDTLQLDEDYAIRELEGLASKAQEGFVAETTKHAFNLPSISTTEIKRIVKSLKEMKHEIGNRVVKLD